MYCSRTTCVSKVLLLSLTEAHDGNPLTNYYQLSLALLALCLFNGSYSVTSVTCYFTPENKNYYFGDQFSVGKSLNPIPLVSRTWAPGGLVLYFSTNKYVSFSFLTTLVFSEEDFLEEWIWDGF